MSDNATVFLLGAGKKPRHIFKRQQRDIEGITKTNKSSPLNGGIDIEYARKMRRLVSHHTNRTAAQPHETNYKVSCEILMHLQEMVVVSHRTN